MHSIQILLAADVSTGRLDFASLSDQTCMELLIEGACDEFKARYQDDKGEFLDICEWGSHGMVPAIKCDEAKSVVSVEFKGMKGKGPLKLDFIPSNVTSFRIYFPSFIPSNECMGGTITTALLPQALEEFEVSGQVLTGGFNLCALPETLQMVDVAINELKGLCDLSALPKGLQILRLQQNKFSGSIVLDSLPEALEYLNLSYNALSGTLDFAHLCPALRRLELSNNAFEGSFCFAANAKNIYVSVRNTDLSGTAVLPKRATVRANLEGTKIQAVVDENGEPHPSQSSFMLTPSGFLGLQK